MSVIINEFEIQMDDKNEETTAVTPPATQEAQEAPPIAPITIRKIMQHQLARLERLRAD